MADYAVPKINTAYIFYGCLVSQADTKLFKSAPTLASGDFKVSIDGGAFANLTNLPTNTPGTFAVKFSMTAGEMNGDNILIVASDAAGAEWCDQCWNIQTAARGVADLAFPATSGRSLAVDTSGRVLGDLDTIKTNPVVNGGTITFPTTATLASTTNITAAAGCAVSSIGASVITATSIAADAITAAKVAADVSTEINAAVLAILGTPAGVSLAADLVTIAAFVDGVEAKTNLIPGTVDGLTYIQGWSLVMAVLLGKVSGSPGSPVFRSPNDGADRVAATTDANSNRTAVTLTP